MDWMFEHGGVAPQEPQFGLGPDLSGFAPEAATSEASAKFLWSADEPLTTEGVDDPIIVDGWMNGFVTNSMNDGGGDTVDDVIIIGIRDRDLPPTGPGGGVIGGGGQGLPGSGGSAGGAQSVDDSACRSVNDQTGSKDEEEQTAVDRLKQNAIPDTTRLLNSVPGGTIFRMPDGADVTIEELRYLWSVTDFEVLRDFDPSNGGPGEADRNGANPVFRIDLNDGLVGYMNNPNGYTYYPLHELAHVTLAGFNYHSIGHGYEANEAYANALAKQIMAAADQPLNPFYEEALETEVAEGASYTLGTGEKGTINPISPCNQ